MYRPAIEPRKHPLSGGGRGKRKRKATCASTLCKYLCSRARSATRAGTEAPWTGTGRSVGRPPRGGPHWEGAKPKPVMNGPQKSDCCEVAMSPTIEIEGAIEESEERRR